MAGPGVDLSPFRVKPQLLKRSTGSAANWLAGREGVVRLLGSLPSEMLGAKNTAVPGTGSPGGPTSPVIGHSRRERRAHLDSAAQRHRMLSPCLFTAPAWNSNGTPREWLAGANTALAAVLDSCRETRLARGRPLPGCSPGTPQPPGKQAGLDSPGGARAQSRPASSPGPRSLRPASHRRRRAPEGKGGGSAVIFSSSGPEEGERPRPATQSPPSWTPRRPPGQAPGLSPGRC